MVRHTAAALASALFPGQRPIPELSTTQYLGDRRPPEGYVHDGRFEINGLPVGSVPAGEILAEGRDRRCRRRYLVRLGGYLYSCYVDAALSGLGYAEFSRGYYGEWTPEREADWRREWARDCGVQQ